VILNLDISKEQIAINSGTNIKSILKAFNYSKKRSCKSKNGPLKTFRARLFEKYFTYH
jgi:hypothetical protein